MSDGIPHRHEDGTEHEHSDRGFTIGRQVIESRDGSEPHEHGTLGGGLTSGPVVELEPTACEDGGQHEPTTNEHRDAWCAKCGERLLLRGYAGGPND